MKHHQRLEYARIAEVLAERGMVEPQALQDALQGGKSGGPAFPDALINANLVGDWDLSAIVAEVYNLPFLTVDMVQPSIEVAQKLDTEFLREHGLVPLAKHGELMTVLMPAIVSAEVLGLLASSSDLFILPVVGSVRTNRRWLEEHLSIAVTSGNEVGDWGDIFDEGNAAVLEDLSGDLSSIDEMSLDEALEATSNAIPPVPDLDEPSAPMPKKKGNAMEIELPELNFDPPS